MQTQPRCGSVPHMGEGPISDLPELIEMAERRLGRVGTFLGGLVLLTMMLVVLVWGATFIWANAGVPVCRALHRCLPPPTPTPKAAPPAPAPPSGNTIKVNARCAIVDGHHNQNSC